MLICEPEDYLLFRHLGETGVPMVRHLAWFKEPNKKVISLSLSLSPRSCFSALDSSYGFQPFSSVVILRYRRFHNNTDTALFLDAPQSGPTINPRNKYRPSCTQKAEVREYTSNVSILIFIWQWETGLLFAAHYEKAYLSGNSRTRRARLAVSKLH